MDATMLTIWLDIRHDQHRAELVDSLRELAADVRCEPPSQPVGEAVELVVTDRWPAASELASFERRGVIGWGWSVAAPAPPTADALLPADATPREVALACRLVGEIVRLRNERAESLRERREYRRLAFSDPLTNVANRRAWDDELARRLETARRTARPLSLVIFDVDQLKRVNVQRGYVAGDQLLQDVAAAIQSSVRVDDFVARLGGDEFGVLLADIEGPAVAGVVERIRASIAARGADDAGFTASAAAGWASWQVEDDAPSLLQRADQLLRQAKRAGL